MFDQRGSIEEHYFLSTFEEYPVFHLEYVEITCLIFFQSKQSLDPP